MAVTKASLLSRLCFALVPCVVQAILRDACPEEARITWPSEEQGDEPVAVSMRNMTLELENFPRNLIWVANGSTHGCICDVLSCLRLCCPPGSNREDGICIPAAEALPYDWPSIYFRNLSVKPSDDFFPIVGYPCGVDGAYALEMPGPSDPGNDFHLFDDGTSIQLDDIVKDRYCLRLESTSYVPLVCYPPISEDLYVVPPVVTVTGFLISVPFFLVTFVVYVLLPELNTIHGLMLRSYVVSLGVSFILMATQRLASLEDSVGPCRFIAFGIHFSSFSSFLWLNVMCIDIWRTFSNITLVASSDQKRRKFWLCSIYVWGLASIFTSVCIFMELLPGLSEDLILTEIEESGRCWFATWGAEVAYFYGPLTAILICNTCMFVATAMKIMWHRRTVESQLNNDQSRLHHDAKEWFVLYFKLFVVMGINWVAEVASWWWKTDNAKYLWYITDTVNALQGVFIFITLVCKRKILRSLRKRFRKIRRLPTVKKLSVNLSLNASQRTRDNTSSYQTVESHYVSTSDCVPSSDSHGSSPSENIVEARDDQ